MHLLRTSATAIAMTFAFACSSSEPPAELEAPSPVASTTPAGLVEPTPTPASGSLEDKNCDDFATQADAQGFYEEAGGPEQDLHSLDPDRNGRACDESVVVTASPASGASAAQPAAPAAAPSRPTAVASPQQHTQVSGDVDGPEGGSSRYESCETDGDERCER